jgi:hypothetical protein
MRLPGVAASSVRAARVPILPRTATIVQPSWFMASLGLRAWPSARRALAAGRRASGRTGRRRDRRSRPTSSPVLPRQCRQRARHSILRQPRVALAFKKARYVRCTRKCSRLSSPSPKCGCRRPIIGSRGFMRRSSTRGMPRGLFGRIDLMARLNHRPNRCLQPQNQTTGISEIAPLPGMLGTCQLDANDPKRASR